MAEKNRSSDLFPMALTDMEKFHWYDSSPEFLNQIFVRFKYRGLIDPEKAELAAQRTVARHPLLNTTIKKADGKLEWIWSPDQLPEIDWRGDSQNAGLPNLQSNDSVPWNVTTRVAEGSTEMWFYMSHSVGDGLAGIQIISDWMKQYHHLVTGDRPKGVHRLEDHLLSQRSRIGLLKWRYLKKLWMQPLGLFGAYKFIFRKPTELVSESRRVTSVWDEQRQPTVIGQWIDESRSEEIKHRSRQLGITTNTFFLGQLMKSLSEFCPPLESNKSGWIRILLPMNIRDFSDRRMPATNRTTIVQIDRAAKDFTDPAFFTQLQREIGIIQQWDLGKLFLIAIRLMSWIPSILKRAASSKKCRGTAVVANLAEPFGRIGLPIESQKLKVGNLILEEFDFVGPIRHRMPVNFTIQKHLGRYRISLHFDPRVLDKTTARDLLTRFTTGLTDSA
ncbi:MAG: hypothetical protein AAGA30_16625 [Planctomycetota bacterium]